MSLEAPLSTLWPTLAVLGRAGSLVVRDVSSLVDSATHAVWLGDLSDAAWGHLAECGWEALFAEGGAPRDAAGKHREAWLQAFEAAARRLADEGGYAGPEGSAERWAGWLALEMTGWR